MTKLKSIYFVNKSEKRESILMFTPDKVKLLIDLATKLKKSYSEINHLGFIN